VVIATPTASGKTLCYNLPVLEGVLRRQARALYLFPTKALAQDQVAELLALNDGGRLGVRAYTFDGDTPSDARAAVRLAGDVVVSNPDMLHQAILPHHTKWANFFESLRYIVIDEVHTYRGVFGSHVANVLRRLQRICAFYGVAPTYLLCSATIGNPKAHAEALIGAPVTAITTSGAPQGARHVLLWNPPVVNADLGIRASARSQATRLARSAIRARFKTLVFAPSRLLVEVITKYLKDVFDPDPRKPARIRAYRGGYLPLERRATEKAMRAGTIDGIVSTSALELGVDIGALDVAILCGYPGSIAGCWQRLGRAGRRRQTALGVLVASGQALDQYVVQHPAFFSAASPEHARIAPDQPLILLDHIRCAAFELPFLAGERYGALDPADYLAVLAESGVLHAEGERYDWIADSYPAQAVNLRSVADGNFVVVDRSEGRQTILAEVDYASAALTLYEGAIYMVQSIPFQVEQLDWPGRKAYVTRTRVDYYTDAIDTTKLKVLDRFDGCRAGSGTCHHGEVHVVRRVAGYKKIRYYSHENIGYGPVSLPDQELHTTAVWWQLPPEVLEANFPVQSVALDAFVGASHALHTVATLAVMAEARDLGRTVGTDQGAGWQGDPETGRSRGFAPGAADALEGTAEHAYVGDALDPVAGRPPSRFAPTLYLFDHYPGGIGLSEPLYRRQTELIGDAKALIEACACIQGCPACVGPVIGEEKISAASPKDAALQVLALLAGS